MSTELDSLLAIASCCSLALHAACSVVVTFCTVLALCIYLSSMILTPIPVAVRSKAMRACCDCGFDSRLFVVYVIARSEESYRVCVCVL
jgi:hypothetical protein